MTTKEFNQKLNELRLNNYNALEDVYNDYYFLLYTTAYSVCNNKADAEDIASSTLYQLSSLTKLDYIENPEGYLYTLARNAALNYVKRNKELPLPFEAQGESNVDYDSNLHIGECLSRLPDIERTIVVEHVFAKFRFKEIAERHHLSVATVKRKYKKAKETLKDLLR